MPCFICTQCIFSYSFAADPLQVVNFHNLIFSALKSGRYTTSFIAVVSNVRFTNDVAHSSATFFVQLYTNSQEILSQTDATKQLVRISCALSGIRSWAPGQDILQEIFLRAVQNQ